VSVEVFVRHWVERATTWERVLHAGLCC